MLRVNARTGSTSSFTIEETGKEIHVFRVAFTRGKALGESRGGELYLPVHEACLEIADRFIEYRADDPSLPEPHDYCGGRICRGVDWECGDDPEAAKVNLFLIKRV